MFHFVPIILTYDDREDKKGKEKYKFFFSTEQRMKSWQTGTTLSPKIVRNLGVYNAFQNGHAGKIEPTNRAVLSMDRFPAHWLESAQLYATVGRNQCYNGRERQKLDPSFGLD